jgi:hypothetical protein
MHVVAADVRARRAACLEAGAVGGSAAPCCHVLCFARRNVSCIALSSS